MYTILKFGGTSVLHYPEEIISIINNSYRINNRIIVVFSALGGVTDLLHRLHDSSYFVNAVRVITKIKNIHYTFIDYLDLSISLTQCIRRDLDFIFDKLTELVTYNLNNRSKIYKNTIITYGEKFAALIYNHLINHINIKSKIIWSEYIITTTSNLDEAYPIMDKSIENFYRHVVPNQEGVIVTTGYVARDIYGNKTTLGRNGSDFTATILASISNSNSIYIYSDVDGILTADPRKVFSAKLIKKLNFRQVAELCYFGSCVLHPKTLSPIYNLNTNVYLKNVVRPYDTGTVVNKAYKSINQFDAITSISNSGLITVKSNGLLGVSNIVYRVFKVLDQNNIDTSFITQSSCDHNLSFNVDITYIDYIYKKLVDVFQDELINKNIESICIHKDIAVITIIGYNMIQCPGIAGRIFSFLGDNLINITAIAQGTSEIAISFIVDKNDETEALRLLHDYLIL